MEKIQRQKHQSLTGLGEDFLDLRWIHHFGFQCLQLLIDLAIFL